MYRNLGQASFFELEKYLNEIEQEIKERSESFSEEHKTTKDEIRYLVNTFADSSDNLIIGIINRNACSVIKESNKYRCVYPERYGTENYAFDPLNLILAVKAIYANDPDGEKRAFWLRSLERLKLSKMQLAPIFVLEKILRGDAPKKVSKKKLKDGLQSIVDKTVAKIFPDWGSGRLLDGSSLVERSLMYPQLTIAYDKRFLNRRSSELINDIHDTFCMSGQLVTEDILKNGFHGLLQYLQTLKRFGSSNLIFKRKKIYSKWPVST